MKGLPEERAITFAHYIIDNNTTVRATAKEFHISKSTVHKDVTDRLKKINPLVYAQVKEVLDRNKSERVLPNSFLFISVIMCAGAYKFAKRSYSI